MSHDSAQALLSIFFLALILATLFCFVLATVRAGEVLRKLDRLLALFGYLDTKVTVSAATGIRIEDHAIAVAADLDESHKRADRTNEAGPGAAADAAARSPPKP